MRDETQKREDDREIKLVNLADVNLVDEELEYSAEDDAFSTSAPVPDAEYLCKVSIGTGNDMKEPGPTIVKSPRGTEYEIPIEVRIADGEYKDAVLFYTAKTTIQRGKKTCTAAGLLAELGYKIEAKTSKLKLTRGLVNALKKEPSVYVTTQWGAWDATAGKRGMMVKRGQDNFPKDEKGVPMHEFLNPQTGTMVSAKARPIRFRSVKKGATAPAAKVAAMPKGVSSAKVEEELELE